MTDRAVNRWSVAGVVVTMVMSLLTLWTSAKTNAAAEALQPYRVEQLEDWRKVADARIIAAQELNQQQSVALAQLMERDAASRRDFDRLQRAVDSIAEAVNAAPVR